MKKYILPGIVAIASIVLCSCSSPAYVQKDDSVNLSNYKTYMWIDTRSSENDESRRATAYADIDVHNSVSAEVNKWGWREVSENPDVLISYDVFVQRTTETQQQPVYTQPYVRYYYNPYRRRWNPVYYPSQFVGYDTYSTPVKEGTITITMVDAQTDKKIWQGWTTERLSAAGISDLDVKRSVRNIFKQKAS